MLLLLSPVACSAPIATQSPARSPGTVADASPPPADPRFTLHCNLPIESKAGGEGFLTFPGGDFTPTSAPLGVIPEIGGYFTQTYDWTFKKWLPVMPKDVSPDGSKYAYQNNDRILNVVDVASGSVTPVPGSLGWNLIAAANDGVYVHTFSGHAGLWFLRYLGGDPTQVTDAGYSYQAIGGGYAYVSAGKDDQTLLRVALKTGVATKFADAPAEILGFDSGGVPVVGLASSTVLMPAPYRQTVVISGQRPQSYVLGDANGLWIPLLQGLFLRTPDGRVTLMTELNSLAQGPCR
ncbi:MAG: hypothetical protein M3Z98_02250 [Candidatus Dormibacteraeota bacterium]|nr:hypothetical protein [Candidatus Dormibacteraeota bacterium]